MSRLDIVNYESASGTPVQMDGNIVRQYLTRGNGRITDGEVMMFIKTCEAKKLNPFENGDIYLIKYGDSQPAQIVVGYYAYMKRAESFPDYRGHKSGITVIRQLKGGQPEVVQKEGCCIYRELGEKLIGGWCKVFRTRGNYMDETFIEVSLDEYSTGKSNWQSKPATMINKVAKSQAFRAAFPNEYSGIYTPEELGEEVEANFEIKENKAQVVVERKPQPRQLPENVDRITKEQRANLFEVAKGYFGDNAADTLMNLLIDMDKENTKGLTVEEYNHIIEKMGYMAAEEKSAKAEPIEDDGYKAFEEEEEEQ